jgi:hypothetical protein
MPAFFRVPPAVGEAVGGAEAAAVAPLVAAVVEGFAAWLVVGFADEPESSSPHPTVMRAAAPAAVPAEPSRNRRRRIQ